MLEISVSAVLLFFLVPSFSGRLRGDTRTLFLAIPLVPCTSLYSSRTFEDHFLFLLRVLSGISASPGARTNPVLANKGYTQEESDDHLLRIPVTRTFNGG